MRKGIEINFSKSGAKLSANDFDGYLCHNKFSSNEKIVFRSCCRIPFHSRYDPRVLLFELQPQLKGQS
jgi:hypothetical protein